MCNIDEFKFFASMIEHVPLPLRARYVFSCAPIPKSQPFVCTMLLKVMHLFYLILGMSEFCDCALAEFCTELAKELTKRYRNGKILQILFSNITLSSAVMAATASARHFGVKVIKYFAVLCINAAITGRRRGHNFKL